MSQEPPVVVSGDGIRGVFAEAPSLAANGEPQVLVRFADGRSVYVPTDLLLEQEDGNFRLVQTVDDLIARVRR